MRQTRLGRPEEVDHLEALRRFASLAAVTDLGFIADDVPSETDEIADAISDDRLMVCTLPNESEEVVGYAMIGPVTGGTAELMGLFVAIGHRGSGRGTLLCRSVIDIARRRGAGSVTVVGEPRARTLYERVGFVGQGEVQTLFGSAIAMTLALT